MEGASEQLYAGSWPVERFPRRLRKLRPRKHRGEGRADRGAAAGAAVREPHGRGSGRRQTGYDGSDGPEAGGDRLLVPAAGSAPRPPRTSAEPVATKSRRLSGRVRNALKSRWTHLGLFNPPGKRRWGPRAPSFARVLHGLAAPDGSAPKAKRPAARSDVAPLGDMHRVGERPRGARPAGSTPRHAPSRLSDGLRATGAATLRLELPAEPRLLPPISGCSQRRSSEDRSNHGNPPNRRLAAMMQLDDDH